MKMPKINFNLALTIMIALIWIIFDTMNLHFGAFLYSEKYLYAIYWLAGFRLFTVILFGYAGFFGIWLGYTIGAILLRDFYYLDAISLGFLSSSAALISYSLWCKFIVHTTKFEGITFLNLFYLISINALLTASLRYSYLYFAQKEISTNLIAGTFAANISGAILFLYAIKALHLIILRFRPKHST